MSELICSFIEYGLTEASTGISVGSQPPLVIPTTQPGDLSPYQSSPFQPMLNSAHIPLVRTFSAPSGGSSPRSARKRLSFASSETASSVDSSSSSGVCDLNLPITDEEASARTCISTPLEEKLTNAVKRNKQRKLSREISPLAHSNIIERLDENVDPDNKEQLCDKERSSLEETLTSKVAKEKCDTPEEEEKGSTFIKSVPFLGKLTQRERSCSIDETAGMSPVIRRNRKGKDLINTVPRRRSLIERISIKSHFDSVTKRRNSMEIPTPKNGKDSEAEDSKLTHLRKLGGHSTEVRMLLLFDSLTLEANIGPCFS